MPATPEGRTIHCDACRSPFPIATLTERVHCPFCGSQQSLSPDVLAELRTYQDQVARDVDAANDHYIHANAWQQWSRLDQKRTGMRHTLHIYLWCLVFPMVVAAIVYGVQEAGLMRFRGPTISFVIMGITLAAVIVMVFKTGRTKREALRKTSLGDTTVACPNCGARGALTPGQAIDTCGFCRAALMPSQAIMDQGLDASQLAAREARMMHYREERLGMAKIMGFSASGYVPYFAFGPVTLGLGIYLVVATYNTLTGSTPLDPELFLGWGVFGSAVAAFIGWGAWKSRNKAAWQQVATDLATQFHGTVYPTVLDWVGWLNIYWPTRYKSTWIAMGTYGVAAGLNAYGFPALLILDPIGHDAHRRLKLHVLVSAWIPGVSDGQRKKASLNDEARAAKTSLTDAGFAVHISEAGVLVEASKDTVKALRRDPNAGHALSTTVSLGCQIAAGAQ